MDKLITPENGEMGQMPISTGNSSKTFNIPEYIDNNANGQCVTLNLTLPQKINSKSVKVKLEGLQELKQMLQRNYDSEDINFQLWKIVKENNPACLEKALICASNWVRVKKAWGGNQIKEIIQNGYANGKGNTRKMALDLIIGMFNEKSQEFQQVILETGFKSKIPKIIAAYLSVLNQLVNSGEIKKLKYLKPYLSSAVKVVNNQKLPIVKNQGIELFKNAIKLLGKDFVWPMIADLQPNTKKQLQNFSQGVENNKNTEDKSSNSDQKAPNTETSRINIYQISQQVQIFTKFDQKWTQGVINAQKWNIKTSLLQQLISKANVVKLSNTDHRHITQMIRRLLNDANFNVVLTCLKLTGIIGKGLRRNFNSSVRQLLQPILAKFRDKKVQMIEETHTTLNNLFYCFSIQEVSDDIKTALKDKSSGMKQNTILWINQFVERKNEQKSKSNQKFFDYFKSNAFQEVIQSLLKDPSAEVREAASKFVCKITNYYGEGIFKTLEKSMSSKDFNKILDSNQDKSISKSRKRQGTSTQKNRSCSKLKNKTQDSEQVNKKYYSIKSDGAIDISEELNKNLKKLNDGANWQNRKEAAQKMISYFQQMRQKNPNSKITSPMIHDFIGILRSRISDPNKQLIKLFINLVGEMFYVLSQKQSKIQSKMFAHSLIESFADKNQANKKQTFATLDIIQLIVGSDLLFSQIGQILSIQDSNGNIQQGSISRQTTLQYLIENNNFVNKIQTIDNGELPRQFKDFPKIILAGVIDKNKQLRAISQRIFKIMSSKVGFAIFKSTANSKDLKPAIKSDVTAFLDKYDESSHYEQVSIISNSSFLSTLTKQKTDSRKRTPSISSSKVSGINHQKSKSKPMTPSNVNNLANSRSRPKNFTQVYNQNQSIIKEQCNYSSNSLQNFTKIQNEMFANMSILTAERLQRQQNGYNNMNVHPLVEQTQIQSSISRLFNYQQLYVKMYSNDPRKYIEASQKLIKLSRDVAETGSIREISDLIIKWAIIRMSNCNLSALPLFELLSPILSLLQKKKIAYSDIDTQMIIYVIREYCFGCFFTDNLNFQTVKSVFKLTIALSSGEKIVKKLLQELKNQTTHGYLLNVKKQGMNYCQFYKKIVCKICEYLVDYFSNGDILNQAASVPELKNNNEFVKLLRNKFHESVLQQFGFIHSSTSISKATNSQHKSIQNQLHQNTVIQSNVSYLLPPNPKAQIHQRRKTPQKPLTVSNINEPMQMQPPQTNTATNKSQSPSQKIITVQSLYKDLNLPVPNEKYEIQTNLYTQPSQHNPLGHNLQKLYPYNEQSVHFFSTLFQPQNQNSQKISTELHTHSNVIFGSVINALMKMMNPKIRQTQSFQKISSKISSYLSITQQSIKCKNLFKHINEQVTQKSIRYTVDQLVYEDENKAAMQTKIKANHSFSQIKPDIFIKGINGVMLRILDNSMPLLLINCLLLNLMETIVNLRNGYESCYQLPILNKNKKIGLLIRCFLRVTSSYFGAQNKQKQKQGQMYNIQQDATCVKDRHVTKFLILARDYIQIMQIKQLTQSDTISNDESVANCLCKIIRVLQRKALLQKNYEQAKRDKNASFFSESPLNQYISSIFESSANYNELVNLLNTNVQHQHIYPNVTLQIDEELRRIIQMLSKSKTFAQGVRNLKIYIQQGGNKFDYRNYFTKMGFEQSFINKVTEEMAEIKTLQTQSSTRSLNPDIQQKLDKLKIKLEMATDQQIAEKNMNLGISKLNNKTQKEKDVIVRDKSTQHGPQDIKRRIQEMKNKVSMSTTGRIR